MDTTIWHVRQSAPNDSKNKILSQATSVTLPISRIPILCKDSTILHISDIHFATGSHRGSFVWRLESEPRSAKNSLSEAIISAVDKRRVGLILITGDLTFTGKDSEFQEAFLFLQRLCARFDLGSEHIVIIPGNHDIQWTRSSEYIDDAPVELAPAEAKKAYSSELFSRFYRMSPNEHLSMGRRYTLPGGRLIDICAVNSSSLEQGKDFLAGMGRVQGTSIQQIADEMEWSQTAPTLKVLMLHHHVALTENAENPSEFKKGFGIAIDAASVLRAAVKHGIQLVLHGHKHRAFIWRSGVYELPEHAYDRHHLGVVNIVGAGSAGSNATEGGRNYFNVLSFVANTLRLEMYRSEQAGPFDRFSTWTAKTEINDIGALTLGEWIKKSDDRNH